MSRNGRTAAGLLVATAVLAADQASKWWVLNRLDLPRLGDVRLLPWLDFTMVWNRGVTFGLLQGAGAKWVLTAVALVVVVALLAWMRASRHAWAACAIGAIAGGALGNILDRARHGAVVDFIRAHAYGWSWYVFNVADAAIVCGVAALILEALVPQRTETRLPSGEGRR